MGSCCADSLLGVVNDRIVSILERCWLPTYSFLTSSSWSNVLFIIDVMFGLVRVLTKVIVFIVVYPSWGLLTWVLVWVSLRVINLLSRCSSRLCSSSSGSHPLWALILILPVPARNVLRLSNIAVSLIDVPNLILIGGEVIFVNIKVDWLIVLHIRRQSLIVGIDSALPAVLARSTKRNLRWHHSVLYHIVITPLVRRLNTSFCLRWVPIAILLWSHNVFVIL